MPDEPYSRHYWRWADEFPTLYENDATCALWYRLLRLADMAWPAAATLPYGVRRRALGPLVESGLVIQVTPTTYRIRGMDKERERRSNAGRVGGLASGQARANARSIISERSLNDRSTHGQSQTNLAEPSIDETRQDAPSNAQEDGADDPAVGFQERTGQFPNGKMLVWIDELGESHGEARLAAMIRSTPMTGKNSADYLRTVRDKLRAEDHAAEVAERADEKRRVATRREDGPPQRITDTDEYKRIYAEISQLSEVQP